MIYQSKKTRGFIALMTVIVISIVLLGLVSAANTAGFFTRFDTLNAAYKRTALGLADSCVNTALLALAQNYAYTLAGSAVVQFGANTCTIQSVTDVGISSSNYRTIVITVSAGYQGAFSTVEAEASIANPSAPPNNLPAVTISAWRESN